MTIHEYGQENKKLLILVHPAVVMWDYFERIVPLMQEDLHIIIPALPGYDEDEINDFTSVEEIAEELADWLLEQACTRAGVEWVPAQPQVPVALPDGADLATEAERARKVARSRPR